MTVKDVLNSLKETDKVLSIINCQAWIGMTIEGNKNLHYSYYNTPAQCYNDDFKELHDLPIKEVSITRTTKHSIYFLIEYIQEKGE